MNLKLAKRARRFARQAHTVMPNPGEVGTYMQHQVTKVIICARHSPRGVYRRLKKEIRRNPELRAKFNKVAPE